MSPASAANLRRPSRPEVGEARHEPVSRDAALRMPAEPLTIGPHAIRNRVVLAPMAGVTDLPLRELCFELGAGMVVSEMVTSDLSLAGTLKSRLRRAHSAEVEPRVVQIAGGDADSMAEAARFNVEQGAQIIDINMGCPAKKVCRKAAGSALLRDEVLVEEILRATVSAVDVPVTLKMRTGWSPEQRNGVRIARIAEDVGIQALAVHGRTRADRFLGAAEYDTIAEIVEAVSIPVLANGDIRSADDAAIVIRATAAAGVMIGRAAQGRPWVCGQIAAWLHDGIRVPDPSTGERARILDDHLERLHEFHGEFRGVRIARKHVGWALGAEGARPFLARFNRLESAAEQREALAGFFVDSCASAPEGLAA